jgi:hypothetical protein
MSKAKYLKGLAAYAKLREQIPSDILAGTNMDVGRWMEENLEQDKIMAIYLKLIEPMPFLDEDEDGIESRALDACELLHYALDDDHVEQVEKRMDRR